MLAGFFMGLDDNLHEDERKELEAAGQEFSSLVDARKYKEAMNKFNKLNQIGRNYIKNNPEYRWKYLIAVSASRMSGI